MAELARLARVSRARITQILDLLMLVPGIQEYVVFGRANAPLRDVAPFARAMLWVELTCPPSLGRF